MNKPLNYSQNIQIHANPKTIFEALNEGMNN